MSESTTVRSAPSAAGALSDLRDARTRRLAIGFPGLAPARGQPLRLRPVEQRKPPVTQSRWHEFAQGR